jgi:hypothetical protein
MKVTNDWGPDRSAGGRRRLLCGNREVAVSFAGETTLEEAVAHYLAARGNFEDIAGTLGPSERKVPVLHGGRRKRESLDTAAHPPNGSLTRGFPLLASAVSQEGERTAIPYDARRRRP